MEKINENKLIRANSLFKYWYINIFVYYLEWGVVILGSLSGVLIYFYEITFNVDGGDFSDISSLPVVMLLFLVIVLWHKSKRKYFSDVFLAKDSSLIINNLNLNLIDCDVKDFNFVLINVVSIECNDVRVLFFPNKHWKKEK